MVKPLDRPCDEDEPAPAPGSEWCAAAGAVLCVVGVACGLEVGSLAVPGAVPCGVGVVCAFGVEPLAVPGAVPCGAGVEVGDDWDAVPLELVP